MRACLYALLLGAVGAGLLLVRPVRAGEDEDTPPAPPAGVEVQARGLVHEAYAGPSQSQPEPAPLVIREPPGPIEEAPPAHKPEGDHVVWIPGYWAWDADHDDFLWVSGFWRNLPPGRTWVPGTWQKVDGGWQHVPGHWALPDQEETEYLPPPPPSIDRGPSVPAPQATSTYIPGSWVPRATSFAWRPGYWVPFRPNWTWNPAHYVPTPAGHLFVEGFWDHPLHERGLLFAPVHFTGSVHRERHFVHRPSHVVQPDFLLGALFVRRGSSSYHFGDYFDKRHERTFVPWVDARVNRVARDFNFSYYRHAFARHDRWEHGLRRLYQTRYDGSVARPPRTLVQQNGLINTINANRTHNEVVHKNINITNTQNVQVLTPLSKVHNQRVTALPALAGSKPAAARSGPIAHQVRLERVSPEHLVQQRKAIADFRAAAQARHTVQARLHAEGADHKAPRRVKLATPKLRPPPRKPGKVVPPHPVKHHQVARPRTPPRRKPHGRPRG
jgi:hypothetical protein